MLGALLPRVKSATKRAYPFGGEGAAEPAPAALKAFWRASKGSRSRREAAVRKLCKPVLGGSSTAGQGFYF